ncbi:MAG: hypothetical protein ACLFRY_01345 [Spirochaetia bacterium]
MKESDFVFTLGYQGDTAIVDGKEARKYSSYSFERLLDEGLFKPAFCKALYNEDEEGMKKVLEAYNRISGSGYSGILSLKRLFGVFDVPEVVGKVSTI